MDQTSLTSMPQDVIDEIIDHLRNDSTTLKTCSLASRAIYEPTRKHLFATITLDRPHIVSSLSQIMERNPNLSPHIRTLDIPYLKEDTLRGLVPLLPALAHTRHLVLGKMDYTVPWKYTPSVSELALLSTVLLELPHLTKLGIHLVRGFPEPHIASVQGLETLHITGSSIARGTAEDTDKPIVDTPNLHEVVIAMATDSVQPVLQAGAKSIQTVCWIGYVFSLGSRTVDLTVLRNLRRLSFSLYRGNWDGPGMHSTWVPISDRLHNSMVAQTLEEISFSINIGSLDGMEDAVAILDFLGRGDMWIGLADKRQFPRMAKVIVHLIDKRHSSFMFSMNAFRLVVKHKLPGLAEAGLLHTAVHRHFHWRDSFSL